MTPLGGPLLLLALACIWFLPRRGAALALVSGALYLPIGLHFDVGFNLFAMRLLEVVAFLRVLVRRELLLSRITGIDSSLLLFTIYTTVVFLIRSPDSHAFEIGRTLDTCFGYFAFRALLIDLDDLKWFLKVFIVPLIPYIGIVFLERFTGNNLFNAFLGNSVPLVTRDGSVRAFGSFLHPSLLGTLGGSLIALYTSLWMSGSSRIAAVCGVVLCLLLVVASNSGA